MKKELENIEKIKNIKLFQHMSTDDIMRILTCFSAKNKTYMKNDVIIMVDSLVTCVGMIIKGTVQIIKEDIMGNRVIVEALGEGETFGEAIVCAGLKKFPISVIAASECDIVFIEFHKIVNNCSNHCEFHTKFIQNMMKIIAYKNICLNNKIDIISKKTIREKLIEYFMTEMKRWDNKKFKIMFSREEMADYLHVNRSAMSRELSKMQEEGMIKFKKNSFEWLL